MQIRCTIELFGKQTLNTSWVFDTNIWTNYSFEVCTCRLTGCSPTWLLATVSVQSVDPIFRIAVTKICLTTSSRFWNWYRTCSTVTCAINQHRNREHNQWKQKISVTLYQLYHLIESGNKTAEKETTDISDTSHVQTVYTILRENKVFHGGAQRSATQNSVSTNNDRSFFPLLNQWSHFDWWLKVYEHSRVFNIWRADETSVYQFMNGLYGKSP